MNHSTLFVDDGPCIPLKYTVQLLNEKLNPPSGQPTGWCCGGKKLKHRVFRRGSSGEMENCEWFMMFFVVVVVVVKLTCFDVLKSENIGV